MSQRCCPGTPSPLIYTTMQQHSSYTLSIPSLLSPWTPSGGASSLTLKPCQGHSDFHVASVRGSGPCSCRDWSECHTGHLSSSSAIIWHRVLLPLLPHWLLLVSAHWVSFLILSSCCGFVPASLFPKLLCVHVCVLDFLCLGSTYALIWCSFPRTSMLSKAWICFLSF